MISLAQMRNDEIFNLHLGSGIRIWHPLPLARHQSCPLIPFAQTIHLEGKKNPEKTLNKSHHIALAYIHRIQD